MATKKPAKVRSKSAPEGETKQQAFRRLANKRVNRVIKDLELVGNLGKYPHTEEEANKIMGVINTYVEALSVRMIPRTAPGKSSFTL